MNRNKIILIILIIISLMFFASWFTDKILFNNYEEYKVQLEKDKTTLELMKKELGVENDTSYISELHWDHMPITYSIVNEDFCSDMELLRIRMAFDIIKNSTESIISFKEINNTGDINISCFDIQEEISKIEICENITFNYMNSRFRPYETHLDEEIQEMISSELIKRTDNETIFELCYFNYNELPFDSWVLGDERYFTAGHALPIIKDNVITSAEIVFFINDGVTGTCSYPSKEIHEIMHSFGIDHSIYEDIMSPESNCFVVKRIDEIYTSCLKYIYSNGELEGNCSDVLFL